MGKTVQISIILLSLFLSLSCTRHNVFQKSTSLKSLFTQPCFLKQLNTFLEFSIFIVWCPPILETSCLKQKKWMTMKAAYNTHIYISFKVMTSASCSNDYSCKGGINWGSIKCEKSLLGGEQAWMVRFNKHRTFIQLTAVCAQCESRSQQGVTLTKRSNKGTGG